MDARAYGTLNKSADELYELPLGWKDTFIFLHRSGAIGVIFIFIIDFAAKTDWIKLIQIIPSANGRKFNIMKISRLQGQKTNHVQKKTSPLSITTHQQRRRIASKAKEASGHS